jgi:hypothetical protein
MYCAWLVSWYSSTSTCRNRRRYCSATSGIAWNRLTVTMIRSSKSIAPAAYSRRWYSPYASASARSRAVVALAANVSGSISSFFRLDTWAAIALAGNW